jgi:hypothetical protein
VDGRMGAGGVGNDPHRYTALRELATAGRFDTGGALFEVTRWPVRVCAGDAMPVPRTSSGMDAWRTCS